MSPEMASIPYPGGDTHFVNAHTTLWLTPADAEYVAHPFQKGQISNFKATLLRGEKLAVAETRGDWLRVVARDGKTGWMRAQAVTPLDDVVEATVVAFCRTFNSPNPEGVNASLVIEAGTLLVALDTDGDFTRVSNGERETFWVRSIDLTTDSDELEISRSLGRVRWSESQGGVLHPYYEDVLKKQARLGGTRLFPVLKALASQADAARLPQ